MLKLLRLLMLLSGSRRYTLVALMEKFEQSDRTIYRHLEAIENAGFILDRAEGSYRLQVDTDAIKTLKKLLHFSEEEAYLLYNTIDVLEGPSPVKRRLAAKLNSLYDFKALSLLPDKNIHTLVQQLGKAIRQNKQVLLHNYRSSNSDRIANRTVEPFEFLSDYNGVWCYDPESNTSKHFKIARIDAVEVLPADACHQTMHCIPFTDAFRMSAPQSIATVSAHLSLKAYNLLLEEYPLAEPFIQHADGQYNLNIPVADFNGIGRFVLGLPGEVKVQEPQAFKVFLQGRIKIMGY